VIHFFPLVNSCFRFKHYFYFTDLIPYETLTNVITTEDKLFSCVSGYITVGTEWPNRIYLN